MALLGKGGEDGQSGNGGNGVNWGIKHLIPKMDLWKLFWAQGKDLIGYSLSGMKTYWLGFQDMGLARSSEVVRLVVGQDETNRILSISSSSTLSRSTFKSLMGIYYHLNNSLCSFLCIE